MAASFALARYGGQALLRTGVLRRPRAGIRSITYGGERGIRTPDRGLAYTRFPSVRLQPLGHLSVRVIVTIKFLVVARTPGVNQFVSPLSTLLPTID